MSGARIIRGLNEAIAHAKGMKYRNKRQRIDGHKFDSRREAAVYLSYKLLERAGEINALEVHPRFTMRVTGPDGISRKIGEAILDFQYWDTRDKQRHWVDVKGLDNAMSKWKRKHIEAQYAIKVELVR